MTSTEPIRRKMAANGKMVADRDIKQESMQWQTKEIVSKGIFMVSVFFLATAARGEWLLFFVYLGRDYLQRPLHKIEEVGADNSNLSSPQLEVEGGVLQNLGLQDLHWFILMAISVSFVMFWGVGLSFDQYFYRNRKHKPETWKCQPDRWLSPSVEWHEFFLGSFNMFLGSVGSGIIACYIINGGKNMLYTNISDQGWLYTLLSIPVLFMYNEAVSYYPHRLFHYPFLYKTVHKLHHRYGSPTLYSATAMHPLEFLMYQTMFATPAFIVPLHPAIFVALLMYGYYFGMMDHSGIKMDSMWPWQPSSMFHDDHHRHFHCNFGFNTLFFDRFHGTLRKKNYKYGEKVFGGGGKATESTPKSSQFMEY